MQPLKGGDAVSTFGNLLSYVLTSALDKRKDKIKAELQDKINSTDSDWVKIRNKGYISLLDNAGPFVTAEIDKLLKKGI